MSPESSASKATTAALNNAGWCDAVCRAHRGATSFEKSVWTNATSSPRFYPNLVTLRPGAMSDVEAAMSRLAPSLGQGWGVKDSFAELDLRAHGFTNVFDAAWLWRDAMPRDALRRDVGDMSWAAVASSSDLVEWERAWEPQLGDGDTARSDQPQFPPALLAEQQIVFVAGRRNGRIVAGGVLNADAGAVGFSNVFAVPAARDDCWAALVNLAQARFPGLPQCTYDRAQSPEHLLRQSFEDVGPLRVWVR